MGPPKSHSVQCPYCGETIEVEVESIGEDQSYIEDCSVCCRPIQFTVIEGDDEPEIQTARSD
jgi:hypothetical protein